ncbi:MAG: histidine kinase [bacterium]|nr:histidine kinase [bacterium]
MRSHYRQHIIEVIAWMAFLFFPLILFPTVQSFSADGALNPALKGIIIAHGSLILFYYFNFYYAIPTFYFTKKTGIYSVLIFSFFIALTLVLMSDPGFNPFPSPPFRYPVFTFFLSIFIRFLLVMLVSLGIANIQRLKQIEQEKIQAELSYLKSQINPHFLFNTLNSIYSLTLKKSDAAPESVTKLAAIMRYAISEATGNFVSLEKEINYITAYIDLEKLRLTSKVDLKYSIEGDLTGNEIAPLLFIPLIENAFKFGVSTKDPSQITILVKVVDQKLSLLVSNKKMRTDNGSGTGIGLENVKKRLDLLYAGKHDLKISESDSEFSVTLDLVLHD